MKKLYILLLAFFFIPSLTLNAALTPPSSYDYSFTYNAVDGEFQFSDGTNTYTPEFTRTADGAYFNYEWTGDADGLLPFEITLIFNRSNTSWTLGTIGYIATDTKIGTTEKLFNAPFIIESNNISDKDFKMYMDVSDVSVDPNYFIFQKINNISYSTYATIGFRSITYELIEIFNPAKSIVNLEKRIDDVNIYINALYWQDLGTSAAVQSTTAYGAGFNDGFNDGYQTAVEEDNAYALGYALGLQEGQDMETGSSIIVLVLALMAFAMMLFGFTSKRRIFNLFASGLFIALGAILFEYPAFIIVTIGLVIVNVYYTFVSD